MKGQTQIVLMSQVRDAIKLALEKLELSSEWVDSKTVDKIRIAIVGSETAPARWYRGSRTTEASRPTTPSG
jgi:hypothetical protein